MDAKPHALPALTGIRFCAALAVVLAHVATWWPQPLYARLVTNGYLGVNLFFVLSGFILTYTYLTPQGSMRGTPGRFLWARLARVYPVYLLGLLVAVPFAGMIPSAIMPWHDHPQFGLRLMANLILVQNWASAGDWRFNVPAWSLSVEAGFYLAFPLLLPLLARMTPRALLLLAGVLWLSGMAYARAHTSFGGHEYFEVLPFRLPEFTIGIIAGLLRPQVPVRACHVLALVAPAVWLAAYCSGTALPEPYTEMGLLDPLAVLLLWGLARGYGPWARVLSQPRVVLVGEASYGLYILHWPLAMWYMHLVAVPRATDPTWGLYAAAYVLLTIAASVLVYLHLERHVRRALVQLPARIVQGAPSKRPSAALRSSGNAG